MDENLEQRIARFVKEHFELRKCRRYVQVERSIYEDSLFLRENDCVCGQPLQWHLDERSFNRKPSNQEEVKKWNFKSDTRPYPCDTFGKIKFYPGETVEPSAVMPGASARYIRLADPLSSEGTSQRDPRAVKEADDRYMARVYELMTDRRFFALPKPQLIIEVTGSAAELIHVDRAVIDRFNANLIQAARNANAWIVTGGTYCGVMRMVGDAINKYRLTHRDKSIPCIGIVSWGVVNSREVLIDRRDNHDDQNQPQDDDNESGVSSDNYGDVDGKWPATYYVEQENQDGYPSLDPGHNCFLLVDNAREKIFGEEIKFRARLLAFISSLSLFEKDTMKSQTPLVLLVVGGGPGTLNTVVHSVCQREEPQNDDESKPVISYQRPVIILPGFGGVGDVLAFAYTISAPIEDRDLRLYYNASSGMHSAEFSEPHSHFPSDFDERIRKHPEFHRLFVNVGLPSSKSKKHADHHADPKEEKKRREEERKRANEIREVRERDAVSKIRQILEKNRNFITLVDLFLPNEERISLDRAIMDAIVKANIGLPQTHFTIAELWNRSDVAARILHDHHKQICTPTVIEEGIIRAIELDQPKFLDIYLKYGRIDLNKFLTLQRVKRFYAKIFIEQTVKSAKMYASLFRTLLVNTTNDEAVLERGNLKLDRYIGDVLSNLLGCYMDNTFTGEAEMTRRRTLMANKKISYDSGVRDVFLMTLLLNRSEMAIKLWILGADHMGAALMASNFLKALSKEARRLDMMDLSNCFLEESREWQERAVTVLRVCYDHDQQRCFHLLTRSLNMWQGLTVLEMAYYGKKTNFMEQPAVQTKLSQIWLGKIASFTRTWLIYLTMCPVFLPVLIFMLRFEESSIADSEQTSNSGTAGASGTQQSLSGTSTMVESDRRQSVFYDRRQSVYAADQSSPQRQQQQQQQEDAEKGGCCPGLRNKHGVGPAETSKSANQAQVSTSGRDLVLLRAGLRSNRKEKTISFIEAGYYLYSAPIAKFTMHSLFLGGFLLLFTYFILVGPRPNHVSIVEIIIWVWIAVVMLDKLRHISSELSLSLSEKLEKAFTDGWLVLELIATLLIIASIIERFLLPEMLFVYPRTTYSLACLVMWMRALRFFYVTERLGPKVITLLKMFQDLVFFLIIYVIIVVAFAAPIHSLLWPNAELDTLGSFLHLLLDVSYDKVWPLFITSLDSTRFETEGTCMLNNTNDTTTSYFFNFGGFFSNGHDDSSSGNSSDSSVSIDDLPTVGMKTLANCSQRNIVAIILYIIFLLLTNIVLLNMLIAFFAGTVEECRASAGRSWRFSMYAYIYEYYYKPILPSPLMIFELTCRMFAHWHRTCRKNEVPPTSDFKVYYTVNEKTEFEYRKLEMFERNAVESSQDEATKKSKKGRDLVLSKLRHVHKSIHSHITDVEEELADLGDDFMKAMEKNMVELGSKLKRTKRRTAEMEIPKLIPEPSTQD